MNKEKRWISSELLFSAIEELLAKDMQAVFTVTGMSMWPLICHGRDSVVIEKVDKTKLRKGDIVLLRASEERYLLHRVTKIYPEGFETTGDGNYFRDGVFPYKCFVAKVVKIVRKGKYINCQKWYMKVYGCIWMTLFPCRKRIFALWFLVRPFLTKYSKFKVH